MPCQVVGFKFPFVSVGGGPGRMPSGPVCALAVDVAVAWTRVASVLPFVLQCVPLARCDALRRLKSISRCVEYRS